ncbi:MAG: hypothetical protein AAF682_26475 [Planctomycetota bacterium]
MATDTLGEAGLDRDARLALAFRRATSRRPTADEVALLAGYLADELAAFEAEPGRAAELLAVGESEPGAQASPTTLAAWTSVCSLILNLDETITRR